MEGLSTKNRIKYDFHPFLYLLFVYDDIIETTGPGRYLVQEPFALVSNSPEFSAPKIIV